MKTKILNAGSKLFFMLFCIMSGVYAFAQDGSNTTTETSTHNTSASTQAVTDNSGMWYTNPVVWVVVGLVFILLLVALLSSKGGKDVVSRSTTTRTEIK